ncbi:hypothetical protein SESBI_31041 [Sesbania bispinosa]|nr:hypothetical protein SESBI_31041 [Sesbania bispinosa]
MVHQQKSSPPSSNGMLPPAANPARGKCTTASMVFDLVKDVEIAISSRKGRTGTAAGDVAFPKERKIWHLFSKDTNVDYPTNQFALTKGFARFPHQHHTTCSISSSVCINKTSVPWAFVL